MNYGDAENTMGLLLLPAKKRGNALTRGTPPAQLRLVGKAPAAADAAGDVMSPDGMRNTFVQFDAFEGSLASARAPSFAKTDVFSGANSFE